MPNRLNNMQNFTKTVTLGADNDACARKSCSYVGEAHSMESMDGISQASPAEGDFPGQLQ